ncbi:MAG: NmrA family transcriptional regulator [Rhodoferax sp.]|nr:NmrA family transcriptional regulator [Rhodoferax sp.]
MKIVVIGGTGLIGSQVVSQLRTLGHDVLAASPSSGVNAVTGEGLAAAFAGAQVVVDVANSPSFEDKAVMAFFEASARNLLAAELEAGVKHHVALSVVGTARLQESGYFRAKQVQEDMIKAGKIPYTIVQSTQFFEFLGAIAQTSEDGDAVRVSSAMFQPIASVDVATAVATAAVAPPVNGTREIAGPERVGMAALVQRYLAATGDKRQVIGNAQAPYFGMVIDDRSLTPAGDKPWLGSTDFASWMRAATKA